MLTEICIFSKIFKQMQVLQKQKDICIFSARVSHPVKCWYILYCTTELFLTKQKNHQAICFLKFKHLNLALVGGVFQHWITFSQCVGLYVET